MTSMRSSLNSTEARLNKRSDLFVWFGRMAN